MRPCLQNNNEVKVRLCHGAGSFSGATKWLLAVAQIFISQLAKLG